MQIANTTTLIKQDPETFLIWNVQILDKNILEKIFKESLSSTWEVDCDLDTFIHFEKQPFNHEIPFRHILKNKEDIENWITSVFQNHTSINTLIPTIAQDKSGRILMQAWVNENALLSALQSGNGTYFSRSRNKLWIKGEESGHFQKNLIWEVLETKPVTLIYHTDQIGAACHTGEYSCFFREMKAWEDSSLIKL